MNPNDCGCSPCSPSVPEQESVASQLSNLVQALFGQFTVTVQNGRGVWGAQCSPNNNGLACFPRQTNEGLICYFLRILAAIGLYSGGTWNNASSYCQNTMVGWAGSLYVASQPNVNKQPDTNPAYWTLLLAVPQGLPGPQGIPGPSGGGSAINFSTRTSVSDTTLTNTDAILITKQAAPINVPVTAGASLLSGKWFVVINAGTGDITLVMDGTDTLNGSATLAVSPGASISFVQDAQTGQFYTY